MKLLALATTTILIACDSNGRYQVSGPNQAGLIARIDTKTGLVSICEPFPTSGQSSTFNVIDKYFYEIKKEKLNEAEALEEVEKSFGSVKCSDWAK